MGETQMGFDADRFVSDCSAAALAAQSEFAVREVVEEAIGVGASIDAALATASEGAGPVTLVSSERITIQRFAWPGGYRCCPHEHRMWAVVGVYVGQETNRRYQRSTSGLEEVETVEAHAGDVVVMDAAAVHTVENPSAERTAALHVYGGDIMTVARHGWDPSGRELPYDDIAAGERNCFDALVGIEREREIRLGPAARYLVLRALVDARDREQRLLTIEEASEVVRHVWPIDTTA